MDSLILSNQEGFSIIESLVSITILGILIAISVRLFDEIYKAPEILLQREALQLADQELSRTISGNYLNDTTYTNTQQNLIIKKIIKETELENLREIEVQVLFRTTNKKLLIMSCYLKQ